MSSRPVEPRNSLRRSLEAGRIHSAYLFSGSGAAPRELAEWFARALACRGEASQAPCKTCPACSRSTPGAEEPIALDGAGKAGPLLRHVGDHPDLLWVERGPDDTRVRIGQVRAVQSALRLRSSEGGRRAAVIADAEWLNQEAQNALLRLLEEPPPDTTLILVTASPAGLLATVRSRCQRVPLPADPGRDLGPDAPEEVRETVQRLEALGGAGVPGLLDWAEEFRGPRAIAAAGARELLATATAWLHQRVANHVLEGAGDPGAGLRAFQVLQQCRKSLAQRNANPQMVAERALLALRDAGRTV